MIGARHRISHRGPATWGSTARHRANLGTAEVSAAPPDYWKVLAARARQLKREGDGVRVIAAKLGVSRSAVGNWVRGMPDEATYFIVCGCGREYTSPRSHSFLCPLCKPRGPSDARALTGRHVDRAA